MELHIIRNISPISERFLIPLLLCVLQIISAKKCLGNAISDFLWPHPPGHNNGKQVSYGLYCVEKIGVMYF